MFLPFLFPLTPPRSLSTLVFIFRVTIEIVYWTSLLIHLDIKFSIVLQRTKGHLDRLVLDMNMLYLTYTSVPSHLPLPPAAPKHLVAHIYVIKRYEPEVLDDVTLDLLKTWFRCLVLNIEKQFISTESLCT